MWSVIPRKLQLTIIVAISILLLPSLQALYQWATQSSASPLHWLSLVVFMIGTAMVLAFNAIWRPIWRRFPMLNRRIFPDLNGTWDGTLVSTWIDPQTNRPKPPIPVRFWITQNLFNIHVRMKTGESMSYSRHFFVEVNRDLSLVRIWYSYHNQPKAEFTWRSTRHEGVAWLEMDAANEPKRLSGQYFTERKTSGDITIELTAQ